MGKTIFAAVVAAILASIATFLVMNSFDTEKMSAAAETQRVADETSKIERDRLERRLVDLEKRLAAQPRAERRNSPEANPAAQTRTPANPDVLAPDAAGGPAIAPDGTPYVSRAELEKYAKDHAATIAVDPTQIPVVHPVEKKSLEDIARDMGLSAGEEANLRNILRESEEEVIHSLFGNRPLADVKQEAKEAKEDPEKQAALVQGIAMNAMGNVGKLMTNQNRMKKKVTAVLGEDRAAKFLLQPRKPVLDPEFEEILKSVDD